MLCRSLFFFLFCFELACPQTLKMNPKIIVVGCGIVGALIAYELSARTHADICVLDKQQPAQGSTGAALGVLMGIINHKVKGRTWRLREASVRRYRSLISELDQQGYTVPFNSQGIASLCFEEKKLLKWQTLKEKRHAQGWPLEIWSPAELKARCPHIALESTTESGVSRSVKAAIHSPADAQVHPSALTRALVAAAEARGVSFCWDTEVTQLNTKGKRCVNVQINQANLKREIDADWVILSAGLGSAQLTQTVSQPLELMPVLGQAMEIQMPEVLGDRTFQPVINGDDIQFVPLGDGRYWLGATVEFPTGNIPLRAEAKGLENLQKGAAQFCPAIGDAKIIRTWRGLRPRPVGQPAPVFQPLGELQNVTLATGHYRNGVLLAPSTAQQVCELLADAL